MKSKNLVICDREETYASAFAHFVMNREELAFRVQTCSDFSHVLAVQREDTIDYLFISEDCLPGEVGQIEAGKIFILTDKQTHTAREGETVIYKYQSGEQILSEFVRQCGIYAQDKDTFLRTVQKNRQELLECILRFIGSERQRMRWSWDRSLRWKEIRCI